MIQEKMHTTGKRETWLEVKPFLQKPKTKNVLGLRTYTCPILN